MDVLLHGVAPIDTSTDLAEHLVPRAPNLCVQVATQRGQILVEVTITIARTHAVSHRPIKIVTEPSGDRVSLFPAARPLDNHFVHIFAHGQLRKTKALGKNPCRGLLFRARCGLTQSASGDAPPATESSRAGATTRAWMSESIKL